MRDTEHVTFPDVCKRELEKEPVVWFLLSGTHALVGRSEHSPGRESFMDGDTAWKVNLAVKKAKSELTCAEKQTKEGEN